MYIQKMMRKDSSTPTIRDVAAHCGLSIATVSAVVNEAGWVPNETCKRVQDSILALGYRPNRLARGLKTSQSYAVGVIVSDVTNPFFTDIVRSLGHVLREHDRNLVLCESDHVLDIGEKNFRMLLEKRVDAIVLIGDSVSEEVVRQFRHEVPIVAIERDYQLDGISKVLVDSEQGGYAATRHLVEQGCQQIGMISGPSTGAGSDTYGRLQSFLGYVRALKDSGKEVVRELVAEGNFRIDGGLTAMNALLSLSEPPDGVFAANDLMALGAIQAIKESGRSVPQDVAIVGYDDIPMAEHASVPLSTLSIPRRELGGAAADLLMNRLVTNIHSEPVREIFSCQLVVRASSRRVTT